MKREISRRKALQIIGAAGLVASSPFPALSSLQNMEMKNSKKGKARRYFCYRSFMPEYETMKKFRKIGVDTITFTVSNNNNSLGIPYTKYQPTWIWERKYDFTLFDKNIHDILDAVPDARLICLIDLNPPDWWVRRGGRQGKRFDPYYDLGRVASSTAWREDTVHYLQSLLKHTEDNFPKLIEAYVLGGGTTTEWFDSSMGAESTYRLQGFCRYMKKHGKPEPVDIIPYSARYHGGHDIDNLNEIYKNYNPEQDYEGVVSKPAGMFRTPNEDAEALDYWKFNNEQVSDSLELFIRKAREVVPGETEIGTFFGYMTDIPKFMHASMGHLEYERIFGMPELDFVIAPISYKDRGAGGSSSSMVAIETLKLNNKRYLGECDQATYTSRGPENYPGQKDAWRNPEEVQAGIKREFSYNLINDHSIWWFDMFGGWYDAPGAIETIGMCKKIWDSELMKEADNVTDVLYLVDPQNMYYVNDIRPDCGKFDEKIHHLLNHSGTPHTFASFNDLERLDMSGFKLVVMCHPFELNAEKMEILEQTVMNSGRTILWIYGPGIINNGKWDPDHVKEVCGTAYKTPGVNKVKMKGWNSVYVHDAGALDTGQVRGILQEAGCHIWCDKLRPIYANSHLVAVHTAESEELTITLPDKKSRITELYTGMEFTNTKSVTVQSKGPDTFLFRYE
jgi:hypothetical protein